MRNKKMNKKNVGEIDYAVKDGENICIQCGNVRF